jgi:hypothetical protein
VLDGLHKLLGSVDNFEDASEIRRHEIWLSPIADGSSINAYEAFLNELIEDELVAERIRVIRRLWARHRTHFERRSGEDQRKRERRRSKSERYSPDRRKSERRTGIDRRRPRPSGIMG